MDGISTTDIAIVLSGLLISMTLSLVAEAIKRLARAIEAMRDK